MYAYEVSHWDALRDDWKTYRISHSEVYASEHTSTNQAESFFSRLRRMVRGQHHHVSPHNLHQFADHAVWVVDHRRERNEGLAGRALDQSMARPVSPEQRGN